MTPYPGEGVVDLRILVAREPHSFLCESKCQMVSVQLQGGGPGAIE